MSGDMADQSINLINSPICREILNLLGCKQHVSPDGLS